MGQPAFVWIVAAATLPASPAPAQPDAGSRLRDLQSRHPGLVEISTIGSSRQGRPLYVARVTDRAAEEGPGNARDHRPSLLIVAGASGMHRVGVETALSVAERLAAEHADALKSAGVYVIPMLNPDSFAFHAEQGRPRTDFARTIAPTDADRDGRVNEDPPEDLNGDGVISMMRVSDPAPGSAWPATLGADPENARLMKTPDAAKGESSRALTTTATGASTRMGPAAPGEAASNLTGTRPTAGKSGGTASASINCPSPSPSPSSSGCWTTRTSRPCSCWAPTIRS
jgi:hypothetical protein